MSAILGSVQFDVWFGPAPPVIKSVVELLYKPGQSAAAARILPNQSSASDFEALALCNWSDAHLIADSYRSMIGTIHALAYRGESYGNVLVQDVIVKSVEQMIAASGVHPDGTRFIHSPAGRILSGWRIVRLT